MATDEVLSYDETGEETHPYKVLNEVDEQQGETLYLTDSQASEMSEDMYVGWTLEEQ